MDSSSLQSIRELVIGYATVFGVKILAALAFWVIGRWLIHFVVRLVQNALARQKVDPTLLRYVGSIVTVTLNVVLVIGILGYFGIQTTTFAALIAAAGVAIGMAWSGLMSNFAAGAFLVVLRPFKVGDFVTIGGVTGTVSEIGLFATTLDTPDNVLTVVGNNKIFSDTIQNIHRQCLPARGTEGAAGGLDRRGRSGDAAQGAHRGDSQRAGRAAGGRGDPRVHAGRPRARRCGRTAITITTGRSISIATG